MSTAHPDSEIDQSIDEQKGNPTLTNSSQPLEGSCQDCSTSPENSAMAGAEVDQLVEADTVLPTPAPERSEDQCVQPPSVVPVLGSLFGKFIRAHGRRRSRSA